MKKNFKFRAKVWRYNGQAAWYFVNIDKKISEGIHGKAKGMKASMRPVTVTCKGVVWKTSMFWSKQDKSYMLPLKKKVRYDAGILEGDVIELMIELI